MKKLTIITFLIFIISIIILPTNVTATPEVTSVIIQADVPEGFEKNILINFTLEDQTNALYRLEKVNNFSSKNPIPVGKHKIDFINILDDIKGEYKVKAPKEIETKKGAITSFKIVIENNIEKNNKDNNDLKIEKSKEKNSQINIQNKSNNNEIKTKKSFFRRYIFTLVIFIISIIGYIVVKIRKN